MKTKPTTTLALMIGLSALNAFAQSDKGNGGGMHYCQGAAVQELYDVYEGRARYHLDIPSSGNSIPEQTIIEQAITKLDLVNPNFAQEVRKQIAHLNDPKNFHLVGKTQLMLVPDANILMVGEGCEYRQLANWDDVTNSIFVKADLYKSMDIFGQAALKLHEAIYKASRVRNEMKNSDKARRLLAELLSTLPKPTVNDFQLTDDVGVLNTYSQNFDMRTPTISRNPFVIAMADSFIDIGKMSSSDLGNYGTMTITIRELEALQIKKIELQKQWESASPSERRQINQEIKKIVNEMGAVNWAAKVALRKDDNKTVSCNSQQQSECHFSASATIRSGNFVSDIELRSSKNQRLTIDFEFKKNDGTVLKKSLPIDVPADSNHSLTGYFTFLVYGKM